MLAARGVRKEDVWCWQLRYRLMVGVCVLAAKVKVNGGLVLAVAAASLEPLPIDAKTSGRDIISTSFMCRRK